MTLRPRLRGRRTFGATSPTCSTRYFLPFFVVFFVVFLDDFFAAFFAMALVTSFQYLNLRRAKLRVNDFFAAHRIFSAHCRAALKQKTARCAPFGASLTMLGAAAQSSNTLRRWQILLLRHTTGTF